MSDHLYGSVCEFTQHQCRSANRPFDVLVEPPMTIGSERDASTGEHTMKTSTHHTRSMAALLGAAALLVSGSAVRAQPQAFTIRPVASSPSAAPATSGYRVVVGESAKYDVELRGRRVGSGSLAVFANDSIDGAHTVRARLAIEGGVLFAKVNDKFESWFDPQRFVSRRFVQDQRELRRTRQKTYEIAPEQGTVRETNSGNVAQLDTDEPLDDVSFLFYVRTLPLRVGDVDTIPRYFKPGREVILRVMRTEMITVPAGTFETIVVQPTITNAGGLFGQGGKAEVYFTNDSSRTLVMLRSHVPVLGSLTLTLRDVNQPR
jgi:hypothetical protein